MNKETITSFVSLIGIAIILYVVVGLTHQQSPLKGLQDTNRWQVTSIVSGVTVGNQLSTRVLATSTARQYVHLTNSSGGSVFCNLSDASSTNNTGLLIAASSTYDITAENLYIGSIQCMNPTASTTLLITAQQ